MDSGYPVKKGRSSLLSGMLGFFLAQCLLFPIYLHTTSCSSQTSILGFVGGVAGGGATGGGASGGGVGSGGGDDGDDGSGGDSGIGGDGSGGSGGGGFGGGDGGFDGINGVWTANTGGTISPFESIDDLNTPERPPLPVSLAPGGGSACFCADHDDVFPDLTAFTIVGSFQKLFCVCDPGIPFPDPLSCPPTLTPGMEIDLNDPSTFLSFFKYNIVVFEGECENLPAEVPPGTIIPQVYDPGVSPPEPLNCNDLNNCDELTDDPTCSCQNFESEDGFVCANKIAREADCFDGVDNDQDGLIDFSDFRDCCLLGCQGQIEFPDTETGGCELEPDPQACIDYTCNNCKDDDLDLLFDIDDPDCQ